MNLSCTSRSAFATVGLALSSTFTKSFFVIFGGDFTAAGPGDLIRRELQDDIVSALQSGSWSKVQSGFESIDAAAKARLYDLKDEHLDAVDLKNSLQERNFYLQEKLDDALDQLARHDAAVSQKIRDLTYTEWKAAKDAAESESVASIIGEA